MSNESPAIDILLLGSPQEAAVVKAMADRFAFSLQVNGNLDEIIEGAPEARLLIVSDSLASPGLSIDELLQVARQSCPESFLIVLTERELSKDRQQFLVKLGAKVFFLRQELKDSKLPFAMSQVLRASYVPLMPMDLVPNTVLSFAVFHRMANENKFIELFPVSTELSSERVRKLATFPELHMRRQDMGSFGKYVEDTKEMATLGLARRCRANFLSLQSVFTNFVFELSNSSNKITFDEGLILLDRCKRLCDELLVSLRDFPKAWNLIEHSTIGDFGSLERAPTVTAYCGIFAQICDLPRIAECMYVALLVDFGVLRLPHALSAKIAQRSALSMEEALEIRKVPLMSLDTLLSRKIGLDENLRAILLGVYERADGKGYPKGVLQDKLTIESQLVRFAKEFDQRTKLDSGDVRLSPQDVLRGMLHEPELKAIFSPKFIELISTKLLASDILRP